MLLHILIYKFLTAYKINCQLFFYLIYFILFYFFSSKNNKIKILKPIVSAPSLFVPVGRTACW